MLTYEQQVVEIAEQIEKGNAIRIKSDKGVWLLDVNPSQAEKEVFFAQLKVLKNAKINYTVAVGIPRDSKSSDDASKIEAARALMAILGINIEEEIENAIAGDDEKLDSSDEKLDSRSDKEFILDEITEDLESNNYKLSPATISIVLEMSNIIYKQLTPSMRVCVIQLPTGHEVIGVAQVLNPENDVEAIGNDVAYKNAVEEVWKAIGGVAKAIMKD